MSDSDHLWQGWQGKTAHPSAPLGGGGTGFFRSAIQPDVPLAGSDSLPHPAAPAVRYLALSAEDEPASGTNNSGGTTPPAPAKKKKAPQQPPPATVTGTTRVRSTKTNDMEIEIDVEILADGTDANQGSGAETKFSSSGVSFNTPTYEWEEKDGKKIVTKLNGKLKISGKVTIQTNYGPSATATQTSAYGRGTTEADELAGNTTLGFHESCHREDYIEFLKTQPFAAFTGKVGMTTDQYLAAVAAYQSKFTDFWTRMDNDSFQKTDEVGYKKSDYLANGPRP